MEQVVPLGKAELKTVLVVEDEVLIRLHLAQELREAGFRVIEAATAEEAISILQVVDDISLILTDYRMPGETDGLALAQSVRDQTPHIKLILISANQVPGANKYFDAIFRKPFVVEELLRRIRELQRGSEHGTAG